MNVTFLHRMSVKLKEVLQIFLVKVIKYNFTSGSKFDSGVLNNRDIEFLLARLSAISWGSKSFNKYKEDANQDSQSDENGYSPGKSMVQGIITSSNEFEWDVGL